MQSFSTITFIDLIFILQVCHTAGIRYDNKNQFNLQLTKCYHRNDCPEDEECVELAKCPDCCEIIK